MSKRFLFNCLFAVLFIAFYFVASSVLNLVASTEVEKDHAFSFVKRTADTHWKNQEWEDAGRYYQQLAESDPLNTGAQITYAYSLSLRIHVLLEILKAEDADSSAAEKTRAEIDELVELAMTAYDKSLDSKQFRNLSRLQISLLLGFKGEVEQSVDYLEMALKDGRNWRGIERAFAFYECEEVLESPRIQALYPSGLRSRRDFR